MKPHKHAELIKAWADGAKIQFKYPMTSDWVNVADPTWDERLEYRIKPEEKKPVVRWLWANKNGQVSAFMLTEDQDRASFNIKLEWSRTEFPE